MRWFTTAWHTGGLTAGQHATALEDYEHHLKTLRRSMRADTLRLLGLDLHEARVSDWFLTKGVLTLALTVGDRYLGYQTTTIVYSDATLEGLPPTAGQALVSTELDRAGDGRVEQRFWFRDGSEFGVRFSEVATSTGPA